MKSSSKRDSNRRAFMDQVRECRDNGYLLSSKKIGSGAFSKVYLGYATHERMRQNYKLSSDLRAKRHTMVAIKIISTAEAPLEYSRKFLPREIYSLNATYKHLNVIQLYETYRNSQRSYLVLELASRGDLLEHINATSDRRCCPGLEEEEARRLFRQLVSAVAHCHNVGIVHRDLKCENILLDDRGFVKLTDFGFANRTAVKNSLLSTFCGSVAYTAPEILMSKKYNGEQADLWSLGVILYAMVTGKLPFKERQPHKMLHLMRQSLAFRPSLSQECQDLIQGLLQLRPRARLGLQQVASHCWMLPASHALFHNVLSTPPGTQEKAQRAELASEELEGSEPQDQEAGTLTPTTIRMLEGSSEANPEQSPPSELSAPALLRPPSSLLQLPAPQMAQSLGPGPGPASPPTRPTSIGRPSILASLKPNFHKTGNLPTWGGMGPRGPSGGSLARPNTSRQILSLYSMSVIRKAPLHRLVN
ncbi:testis-specific serine/threonine-protein kinase 5-like isoform X1 [Monodelphis domestica]|uniref:testis-specific serine/threonine-protein kinase 5-like isoform X1 n=1 Tax=Monodelphis domestica TaxID=13616 RepID=UPI0000F2C80C|nr:testis-specific serine/threonine-protein kinase 5-like isoform X1 [Monodelphis domestica]